MNRCRVAMFLATALAAMPAAPLGAAIEPDAFVQTNISSAKIVENNNRFVVETTILATDIADVSKEWR